MRGGKQMPTGCPFDRHPQVFGYAVAKVPKLDQNDQVLLAGRNFGVKPTRHRGRKPGLVQRFPHQYVLVPTRSGTATPNMPGGVSP